MLGVRLATLRGWMQTDGFIEALHAREREQAAAARRLARQAVVNSASRLCQLAADPQKTDAKVLVDLLKASGSFETEADDPGAALAELIKLTRLEEEEANDSRV
jgi:hypothetical protein